MKIRYHDNKGRERWAAVREIVPAGSFINEGQIKLEKDHVVSVLFYEGNPYDQYSTKSRSLYFRELTK